MGDSSAPSNPGPAAVPPQQTAPADPSLEVEALAAVRVSDGLAENEVLYLPAGVQTITPVKGPKRVTVLVDRDSATAMEAHRQAVQDASGKRCYFDFRHEDREASFWPSRFDWREGRGVVAVGEFSAAGKTGVQGKMWREFSPRCWLTDVNGSESNPARIKVNPSGKPNLGGFVNDGAFSGTSIWAQRNQFESDLAGAAGDNQNNNTADMKKTVEELAALKANQLKLEGEIQALKGTVAANDKDELAKARLDAKQAESRAIAAELANEEISARAAGAEAQVAKNNEKLADQAIDAAKRRGAIPTQGDKSAEISAQWRRDIIADPTRVVLLEAMQGNPAIGARVTAGAPAARIEGGFSAVGALRRYNELITASTRRPGSTGRLTPQTVEEMRAGAIEAARFYQDEIDEHFRTIADMPIAEIMAADNTDANLGTLAGTLVLQRSLPLFKYNFPVLANLYTDFSATPGVFNQTETTRVVTVPAVQTYDATADTDGRPKGWTTATTAKATDVPVKLDEYVGVPIVFSQSMISQTIRRLFDEQGPAAIYAMAKYFVSKTSALFTPANYNGYAVKSGALVPDAYPSFVVAQKDFSMGAIDDLEAIFDANEVPASDRFLLLNAKYHGQLRKDSRLGLFFAAMQKPDMISEGNLPKLDGFLPFRAPWLPTTNSLVGFAGHKASVVLKQRLPMDWTAALNVMVPGSVTTIADPETGLSCALVQYLNMTKNYAEWRLESLLGAAVGDKRGGLCITSQ